MKLERRGPVLAAIAAACIAAAGCCDGTTVNGSMVIPISHVDVCQGFSHGISLTLPCAPRDAGADGFCHYVISTSDSSVLSIFDSVWNVPVNTTTHTGGISTVGGNTGTVTIFVDESPAGTHEAVGTATVVPQACF
jgi:hypothetical protein